MKRVPSVAHATLAVVATVAACSIEPPPSVARETDDELSGSLVPSPEEERLRRDRLAARDLERMILSLPGVTAVRARVVLADRSPLSRDPTASASAAIVATVAHGGPSEAAIRDLVVAAVPDVDPTDVHVFLTESLRDAPRLERVGPFEVAAQSSTSLRLVLGGLLILCLALAATLFAVGLRLRRSRIGRD